MANTLKFGNGEWYGKKDTILAYNDENSNYKPLPFDFSRASNATVVNKDGLIETVGSGQPRIDYKDDSEGALLLEPSRSNILPYSTLAFNGGSSPTGWSVGFQTGTYTHEEVTYKGQTAVKHSQITEGRSYIDCGSLTLQAGVTYTYTLQLDLDNCTLLPNENIVSTTGFSTNFIYTFSDVDSNGVLSFQFEPGADITGNFRIGLGVSGNGTAGSVMTFSMPQVEAGSYATSYIPTQGSAVTRLADSCSQTVPDGVIGQTEGTLYTEINITKLLGATTRSIVRLGNAVDLVDFSFLGTLNNSIRAVIRTSANTRFQAVFEIQSVGVYKLAIGYKSNDSVFYVNGVQINNTINTSFTMPSIEDITYDYSTELNDSVNQTKLYNTRLSNSELQALTT